jgi:serine/threonine-protein kinase RsbW
MRRRFHAVPEAVAQAVHAVERAMQRAGLPDELMDRVTLAAGEATGNAVEHGCQWDPACSFEVSWEAADDGYWLRIEDGGAGIDPARLETATLPDDPLSTSGRGLFLIRELADDVRLEAGGRRLAMRFVPTTA